MAEKRSFENEDDIMSITPIGAGNEVGRSCIILKYKGKTVMLDCGIHPAYSGLAGLPFFDEIDPSTVDLVLVTHFHLDHAASLPYFTEKTDFKGRVFMTHPTKAIYKWLLSDFVKVSNVSVDDSLYDEQDLLKSYEKIEAVDYHQQIEVDGIKFTSYNAGHVLGAAMFLIEIAGVKVLYTGDYSREEDRHLMAAEKPSGVTIDVLICESTYGVQSHEPRVQRESRFTGLIHEVVKRGGRCLIPVFALGRAQELLLILDEHWQSHRELHGVPIYYASSLAKKCMTVYQTYTNMMNDRIRKQIATNNPFIFKHISNLKSMEHFEDAGACVMMASPGMLQSGLSRELFELWCSDPKNGVIIPGYCVEGTLAKHILNEPTEITSMTGTKLPVRLSIAYISFSAHVDYTQNSQFIDEVKPSNLVLVHGDSNEMTRLRNALSRKYEDTEDKIEIHMPRNCESVELYFKGEKYAKVIGAKAIKLPEENETVSGILISKGYENYIVDPEDLKEFTQVSTCSIYQKQLMTLRSFSLAEFHLKKMFGSSLEKDTEEEEEMIHLRILGTIHVKSFKNALVSVEWKGDPINDILADSVLSILLGVESSRASVKETKHEHNHSHEPHDHEQPRMEDLNLNDSLLRYLSEHYKNIEDKDDCLTWTEALENSTDPVVVNIDKTTLSITCADEELKKRIQNILSYYHKLHQSEFQLVI